MEMNFHIHVKHEEDCTRVAVADEDGTILSVQEFLELSDGRGSRMMRALAWTMSVLLRFTDSRSKVD